MRLLGDGARCSIPIGPSSTTCEAPARNGVESMDTASTLAAADQISRLCLGDSGGTAADRRKKSITIVFLFFLEWTLQLSILFNIFMAGLCGLLIYQDRKKAAPASGRMHSRAAP